MLDPEIQCEVEKVRRVLEENSRHISETFFGSFPKGSCGTTCCFLNRWLNKCGFLGFTYTYGERSGISHAWLQIEEMYIDITSDQFADGMGKVYIGPTNKFFQSFKKQRQGSLEISPILVSVYSKFAELLETS